MTVAKYVVVYAISVLIAFVAGKIYGKATEQAAIAEIMEGWKYAENSAALAYADIKNRIKKLL